MPRVALLVFMPTATIPASAELGWTLRLTLPWLRILVEPDRPRDWFAKSRSTLSQIEL